MSIFNNKITRFITPTLTNEQLEEFLPLEKEKEIRNLIKESVKNVFPRPNDDVEFVVPLFDARKHYKHLKKQIWKFSRKY